MAVDSARFAHCQVRGPVAYRAKSPFRPELVAPLDMANRIGEVYTLDHELDRAVLQAGDRASIREEDLVGFPGPGGAFVRPLGRGEGPSVPRGRDSGPATARRRLAEDQLRMTVDSARFRPPWNASLLREAHAILVQGLDSDGSASEFRRSPHVARDAGGAPVFTACAPDRISDDLDSVLDWMDRYGASFHPVVPATVLFEALHAIRPFPVGNSTLARSLSLLYLRSGGLRNVEIPLVASTLFRSPDDLGRLLLWTEATGSYTELVDYSLDAILVAYAEANLRWLGDSALSPPLEEVELRLLARARRGSGWFSARDAMRWVGARSDQTILRHLNAMVDRQILETLGNTRAKRYRVLEPSGGRPPAGRPGRVASPAPDPR
jgi:Fic family protein